MSHTVLVIDRYPVELAGLRQALEQAGHGVVAVSAIQTVPVSTYDDIDLVIFEPAAGKNEFRVIQRFLAAVKKKTRDSVLIACSDSEWPSQVARAMILGASDYRLKSEPVEVLVSVVQRALLPVASESSCDENRISRMKAWLHEPVMTDSRLPELTLREQQVLRHLGAGLANQEISQSLQISIETVKELVQGLLRKLGVEDRTAAAVKAVRLGVA